MMKLITAVVVYIKIQNEINNAASSFSKYGECSSIHIVERWVCIVMPVNCMCITKVGMHCYACKLHVYNKGGYALLCL